MRTTEFLPPLALHRNSDPAFAGIVTLILDAGPSPSPVVVLDEPLIRRLESALRSLPRDITGLVIASASPRVFIAGADLKAIQAPVTNDPAADDRLDRYLAYGQRVFGMIADLPCPTAAAISGAALGGGLELAMHCDGLIGAPNPSGKAYPIGLPEAGLSICPGWGGTNLFPARIDPGEAIRRTCDGKPMTYDEAVAAGFFDRTAPAADSLLSAAKQWIAEVGARSGPGFSPPSPPSPPPRRDGAPSRWIGRPEVKARVLAALAQFGGGAPADPPPLPQTESTRAVLGAIRAGLEQGPGPRGWKAALEVERGELVRLRNTPGGRAAIQAFFDKSKK